MKKRFPALGTPASADWAVLELGSGTGNVSLLLAPLVGQVVGVDPSGPMLERMQSKAEAAGLGAKVKTAKTLLASPDDPALQGQRFDLVVAHLVFHHIPRMQETLRVMAQVLKPGGSLVVSDFEDEGVRKASHPKELQHGSERHALDKKDLWRMLQEEEKTVGLKDLDVYRAFEMEIDFSGINDHQHTHGHGHQHGHGHGHAHGSGTGSAHGAGPEMYPFLFAVATKA